MEDLRPTRPVHGEPCVSIVIVTARNAERLLRCLEAIAREAPDDLPIEVIVVLNAAAPDVGAAVAERAQGVRVVASDVPLGFAGGVNLGARTARGRFLHVLHDDTVVFPGWLDALVDCLEDHPPAGAVTSVTLDAEGAPQAAGWVLWREGRTSPPWAGAPPDPASLGAAFPIDYGPSAAVMVRREVWDAVGGLDEDFHPAYFVDVDLAMAIRREGHAVLCEPRSRVLHEHNGSTGRGFREFVSQRNHRRFVAKWAGDLRHQEPYADDGEALARARRATERRAATLQAPGPARRPARAGPEPETVQARLEREHRGLRRDLEVKAAYIDALERRAEHLDGELERVAADAASAASALAELRDAHGALQERHEGVRREHAGALEELQAHRRTLDGLESSVWWRLGRRLPAPARVAASLRRLSRRAASSRRG